MTVSHDMLVEYECEPGFVRSHMRPVQCKTGSIVPSEPVCVEDDHGLNPRAEPFNQRQNEQPRLVSVIHMSPEIIICHMQG